MALWQGIVIFLAAFLAGAVNSVAGGGTLISFPALIWIGRDPIIANATSTVAILPGSLAGMLGFRRELKGSERWIELLVGPSFIGAVGGALLLLHTSSETFAGVVPYLILLATLLFAAQEVITRKAASAAAGEKSNWWWVAAVCFQFLVGLYGGYFGAGIGIMMLAALGILGLTDIHQMNGIKNLLAFLINGVAAACFVISGRIRWADIGLMAVGSVLGGYFGAGLARKLGRRFVRYVVVAIGLAMAILMLVLRR
jgi:uncharacterized membrane protein YfcA